MKRIYYLLSTLALIAAAICNSCDGDKTDSSDVGRGNMIEAADFLRVDSLAPGAMHVGIINPWDSTSMLADYLVANSAIPQDSVDILAAQLPVNVTLLRAPLKRIIVYSAVHAALIAEMGYADAIVGVADAQYIKTPEILARIADGRIADIGSSIEPSLEKIVALRPDAILLSPYNNSGHGVADKAAAIVVDCADYMETTPLGRAEWSKFYAMLLQGVGQQNPQLFKGVKQRYDSLVAQAAGYPDHPRVITELPHRGIWMVPGGRSYAARLIADAGATYPFADDRSPGSLQLPHEKVYMASETADFWLLKSLSDITLDDVAANSKYNRNIYAYRSGGVFNANTSRVALYEETPFHPDLLLRDYVAIFHHTGDSLRYFNPVK